MTADNRFIKKLTSIKPLKLAVQVGLVCGLALAGSSAAYADAREQAKRIHDRLAGVPPTEEMLCAMETAISGAGDALVGAERAAHLVMTIGAINDTDLVNACDGAGGAPTGDGIDNGNSKRYFYSVSLKNFVMPWTNEAQTVFADMNDYVATVIGVIRDEETVRSIGGFDHILSADILYKGNAGGLTTVTPNNNLHYEELEDGNHDLSDPSVLVNTTQATEGYPGATEGANYPAGVVTTRAASLAFFSGGTNRLMWRATSMNYLCRDLEQMKDTSGVPDRIREDVSRSPGGDSAIFLSSCLGCHTGMDPLAGAYAYYDHTLDENDNPDGPMLFKANSSMFPGLDDGNPTTTVSTNGVTQKHLINSANFKYGFETKDDQWTNYWRKGPNSALEWGWNDRNIPAAHSATADPTPTIASGNGPKSLGYEVTSTKAFAQCQVEKVYKFVCLHDPIDTHGTAIESITQEFKDEGYLMKNVFAKVAPLCMGQ